MLEKLTGWELSLLEAIKAVVAERRVRKVRCSIALTGGRSAEKFYRAVAASPGFLFDFRDVDFFWGDERCVSYEHADSNYRLAIDTLFANGIPKGAQIHRMEVDGADLEGAANKYASLLPSSIDVLLLSMGEDGHIASLFPQSSAMLEAERRVVLVRGKPQHQRLTLTPLAIEGAQHVFVLALGLQKFAKYGEALSNPSDVHSIPARLVLRGSWIFDVVDAGMLG